LSSDGPRETPSVAPEVANGNRPGKARARHLAFAAIAVSVVSLIIAVVALLWAPLRPGNADSARFIALGIAQLRPALAGHKPFRNELIMVGRVMPSEPHLTQALETLSAYADQGVPTLRELQARFTPVVSSIVLTGLVGSNGGGFDRAVIAAAAALHLHVLVYWASDTRPASEIAWEARARLDAGDLPGALKALGELPEREAKLAELWVKEAQGRVIADQVLEGLELVARSLPTDMARRPLAAN
jgi:hypothetical protein